MELTGVLGLWVTKLEGSVPWFPTSVFTDGFVHHYNGLLSQCPFWGLAIVVALINAYRRRWWALGGSLLIPAIAQYLGLWALFFKIIGWWFPLWLSVWGIAWLLSRYLVLWSPCVRYARYFPMSWPAYSFFVVMILFQINWWSGCISIWLAMIPWLLCRRLSLFSQLPEVSLEYASKLGADKGQRLQWVAGRWLYPRLRLWQVRSMQWTFWWCVLAGGTGLPGAGRSVLNVLHLHRPEQLIGIGIGLILSQLFLYCLDNTATSQGAC
ncbi:MAG: hypothetical protein CENE_00560 [Candidatus Celerinatantimonas neptuna]|nr:MAG: hypothetical protein CENE_00560 [Candidatus Celerinatantimonas neptuna]